MSSNMIPSDNLVGKTILITGAARRIGSFIAQAAAEQGARVIIHYDTSKKDAVSLADDIRHNGGWAQITSYDLSDLEHLSTWFENISNQWGAIDGLVNNASVFDALDWQTTTLSDWQRTMNINLTAPFFLSQAFSRHLPINRKGQIVNLLDWRALRPGGDHLPYTISKAGLAALTSSLAVSLAPQICVNGVALGAILPPITGEKDDALLASVPANRWGKPSDVTDAVLFFLSNQGFITGEILHVDGGRHLI